MTECDSKLERRKFDKVFKIQNQEGQVRKNNDN